LNFYQPEFTGLKRRHSLKEAQLIKYFRLPVVCIGEEQNYESGNKPKGRIMTRSLEDYLKTVSILAGENGGQARMTDIAARLNVTKPSVFTALKVLEERGLVEHRRYKTVTLTPRGREEAAAILGRYALLNAFFRMVVGVSAANAEKDACLLEHLLSRESLRKIKNLVEGPVKKLAE
jgi:DtxR family Mn-dependent transcriptional regulator